VGDFLGGFLRGRPRPRFLGDVASGSVAAAEKTDMDSMVSSVSRVRLEAPGTLGGRPLGRDLGAEVTSPIFSEMFARNFAYSSSDGRQATVGSSELDFLFDELLLLTSRTLVGALIFEDLRVAVAEAYRTVLN